MKKLVSVILSTILGFTLLTAPTYAEGVADTDYNPICKQAGLSAEQLAAAGCKTDSDVNVVNNITSIINTAIGAVGLVAVIVIIWGGFMFMTASGDPNKIKQAKDMVLYALIAVIVAALAYTIVSFVSSSTGL